MRTGDKYHTCVELAVELGDFAVVDGLKDCTLRKPSRYLSNLLLEAGKAGSDEASLRLARIWLRSIADQTLHEYVEGGHLQSGADVEEALDASCVTCGLKAGEVLGELPVSIPGRKSFLVGQDESRVVDIELPTLLETKAYLFRAVLSGWKKAVRREDELKLGVIMLTYEPYPLEEGWKKIKARFLEDLRFNPGTEKIVRLLAQAYRLGDDVNENAVRFFTTTFALHADSREIIGVFALRESLFGGASNWYPRSAVLEYAVEYNRRLARIGDFLAEMLKGMYMFAPNEVRIVGVDEVELVWAPSSEVHFRGAPDDASLLCRLDEKEDRVVAWLSDNPRPEGLRIVACLELRKLSPSEGEEPIKKVSKEI